MITVNTTQIEPLRVLGGVQQMRGKVRDTITITFAGRSYAELAALFTDGAAWSITELEPQAEGEPREVAYDKSEYCLAGNITDFRDGTLAVTMCRKTVEEAEIDELASAVDSLMLDVLGGAI